MTKESKCSINFTASMTKESKCSINFTPSKKNFYFKLRYNGANSFSYANVVKTYQF